MTDAITLLVDDHRRVDELFVRFEQADDDGQKRDLVRTFTRELSIHAAIEEQWLYPVVAQTVSAGQSLAGHGVEEHQQVKDLLGWLDTASPSDEGFDERVTELVSEVRHHVEDEENDLFPALRQAVPDQQLQALGTAMAMAKALAPTRPHPHAPNMPPGNVFAGPVAAIVDALRDQLPEGSSLDQLLDAASLGQDTAVQALQSWIRQVGQLVPGMAPPSYGEGGPDTEQLLDQAFDAAERLLRAQRAFVTDLLKAGPSSPDARAE